MSSPGAFLLNRTLAVAGTLLVCLFVTPAYSQWVTHAKVQVPFEFTIHNTVLPPGNYIVQTCSESPSALNVLNVNTHQSAMVMYNNILLGNGNKMAPHTKLVFRTDGDVHVLHQVVFKTDNHIHDIVHGKEVAELLRPR